MNFADSWQMKKYELVNKKWIRLFPESGSTDLLKLESITALGFHESSIEPAFSIGFHSNGRYFFIKYKKAEEAEFKKDSAYFEGLISSL